MDDSERRSHLLLVIDEMFRRHEAWLLPDGPNEIPEPLTMAVEDAIAVYRQGAIPADLRKLADAVQAMATGWKAFEAEVARSGNPEQVPGGAFWALFEAVRDARKAATPQHPKRLEKLTKLEEQKVPDHQICRMYDWMDPDGRPQLWKLEEEREEPGKWTKNLVSPAEKRRLELEKEEAARENREEQMDLSAEEGS
jgi:hypothetical protein